MYECTVVVGKGGQITIPKAIRDIKGIKAKDMVMVKTDGKKIIIEKVLTKKEKEELMKEYYTKYAKENEQIAEEWKYASAEADRLLDDY